jgi:hypothetical protein
MIYDGRRELHLRGVSIARAVLIDVYGSVLW